MNSIGLQIYEKSIYIEYSDKNGFSHIEKFPKAMNFKRMKELLNLLGYSIRHSGSTKAIGVFQRKIDNKIIILHFYKKKIYSHPFFKNGNNYIDLPIKNVQLFKEFLEHLVGK